MERIDNPTIIALDLTYKCTLKCLHCFNSSGEHDNGFKEMTDDEILNFCDEIILCKPSTLCLCGGETLIRKELVYKVIKKISDGTNNHTAINMVSNGELLTLEVAKKLKESGINMVQISLDGASPETHEWLRGKKGSFESAIQAIKNLKECDITVSVSCTPTKKNIHEYSKAVELCESLGVQSFRAQPLMLMGRASKNLKDYVPSYLDYLQIRKVFNNHIKNNKSKMITEWGDPIEHLTSGAMDWDRKNIAVNIDAYGNIEISPYIPIRIGNIKRYSLSTYWKKGLNDIWSVPFVKSICKEIKSAEEMELNNKYSTLPKNFIEKQLYIDLVDTENFNSLTLEEILSKWSDKSE
ncbi:MULTISPECIES: radical SAM/SPASM domain-containing protein [Clostridiaceae]|uniref:Radical SAM superfamily enzyme, MoaA/NifB/PqqE/SkfB family n=1 Tax=Caloramator proteoclasticus DSM 10124 TaxID=1121262 RepID=A0A1M4X9C8_9CLOT|nr:MULTISPECIES: radical SAM protein [Clostridiaceae]SHE90026.1 Radical SAM superfamily enzyme, MoaA/NifB/PqqE/SkfB family [Caloramator proteoclasticus DSM 10124]